MDNTTYISRIIHEHRNTESWLFAEGLDQFSEQKLVGAHLNIHDYYGARPILVFSIKQRGDAQVFRDVYVLSPGEVPEEFDYFVANGLFVRQCLPNQIKDPDDNIMHDIHLLDGIQLLFEPENMHTELARIASENDCMFIGVYGVNPLHRSRGYRDDFWQEETQDR